MPLVPGRGFVPPDPVNLVTGRAWKRAVLGDRPTQAGSSPFSRLVVRVRIVHGCGLTLFGPPTSGVRPRSRQGHSLLGGAVWARAVRGLASLAW